MVERLRVGELAARSGVSRKALRLYESRGILPAPRRSVVGYREYAPDTLALLGFISRARRLGLTLAEIGHITALRRAGSPPCAHVRQLLEQKVSHLEGVLRELRRTLSSWQAAEGLTAMILPPHRVERR